MLPPSRACSRYAAVRLLRLQEMRHTAAPHSLLTHPIAASVQGTRRRPKLAPAGLICPWHGIAHDELVVQPPGARRRFHRPNGSARKLPCPAAAPGRPVRRTCQPPPPRACNIAQGHDLIVLRLEFFFQARFLLRPGLHASTGSTMAWRTLSRRCAWSRYSNTGSIVRYLAIARTHRRDARTSDSGSRSIASKSALC